MVLLSNQPKAKSRKERVAVIIKRPVQGEVIGSDGLRHLELGSRVEVSEETARMLAVLAGAAVYVDRDDDPSSNGAYTVTPLVQAAIDSELALIRKRDAAQAHALAIRQASEQALLEKYGRA